MTRTHDDHTRRPTDAELQEFAADPTQWGEPEEILTGADAAAAAQADLEAAGFDVDAFDQRMGRPRLGPGEPGTRSPRVNVSISPELDARIEAAHLRTGKKRSALVREVLERSFPKAG
jgi:hypothetical protein